MKIHCIACQTAFHYQTDRIDLNGTMVRCRMCHYIFMVFPNPDAWETPVTQDTNIDQSILNDLLEMEANSGAQVPTEIVPEERCSSIFECVKGTDATPEEEANSEINDKDCADLPDLSDLEKMIDWDDTDDPGDSPPSWC